MGLNVAQKLIQTHLREGEPTAGSEIALAIDQALVQDATGTLVMLTLEALQLERAATELAVQYVDHNLLQEDHRNPEDHAFLESAAKRFGLWFSPPGNGVSHPLHMASFGIPGKTLLGSDSHTPASGAIGQLAFGAGGLDVAMAIAGEPYRITMPEIWGVKLVGTLPDWVSAKDIILAMLRRHGVKGGLGRIIEYYGPGLDGLSAMDRHVIANMGTELGATTTVFPSDEEVQRFLHAQGRGGKWQAITADDDASYDITEEIDLSELEPLVAKPSSPDNVVPVREVAGAPIYQAYLGSSANPGLRDFAVPAEMVAGRRVAPGVSFDVNPTSRSILEALIGDGHLGRLLHAGARLHQAGCNGCIGMGQAPARGRNSLRTVPRNFPGRSGTREDSVFLCSPETATASALTGVITDPRDLDMASPRRDVRQEPPTDREMFVAPLAPDMAKQVDLVKGGNISSLPEFEALPDTLNIPVLVKVGDNISTDEIMPAGSQVLPFRSNIPKIARFVFRDIDKDYPTRADNAQSTGGHAVVGGDNYGQGSSREHAVIAPRSLGLRAVIAKSFARIHRQNLVNYGVLPLTFCQPDVFNTIEVGQTLHLTGLRGAIAGDRMLRVECDHGRAFDVKLDATGRERDMLLAGGMINWYRERKAA